MTRKVGSHCTIKTSDHANIECRSPPGRGDGVFSVFVTAGNQLSEVLAYAGFEKDGLLQVTYNPPTITTIVLPPQRTTAGNYILRIEGINFGGNATTSSGGSAAEGHGVNVSIGFRLCSPIVLLTHNAIECLVPENEGGKDHGIRVVVKGLMSSGTVENAPTSARMSFSISVRAYAAPCMAVALRQRAASRT